MPDSEQPPQEPLPSFPEGQPTTSAVDDGNDPQGPLADLASEPGRQAIASIIAEAFSSPYPPPEVMRLYNEAVPGLAERMVAMTEEIGRHKREMEMARHQAQVENMRRDYMEGRVGQICAVGVVLITTAGAVLAGVYGAQVVGALVGVGGVGSIVAAFIYGRKHSRQTGRGVDGGGETQAPPEHDPSSPT